MKIAVFLPKGVYGGGERVLITLMREFSKRKIDVVGYTRCKTINKSIVPCKMIVLDNAKSKLKQVLDLSSSLKQENVGKVIVFGLDTIFFIATRLAKVDYLYSLRVDPLQVDFKKLTYKYVLNKCERIVFQTKHVQSYFPKSIQEKSCVIPNPILDDDLPEVSDCRKKKIILVGRLSEEKNIEMAIRAFSQTKHDGYSFHIYGTGPLLKKLQELVKQLSLEKEVVFEGQVVHVVDYIKDAEIFLLTSNFEGMPNALIEGLAMGLACISTDFPSGAAHELIDDGQSGFVVPMNDVNALAKRMQILISDDALRHRMQKNSVEIRQRLALDKIISQWVKFYNIDDNYIRQ